MNMTRLHDNIILLTDSYKLSHYKQYPPGTQTVFSYFESRGGAEYPYTVFFGLQYFIRRYLQGQVVTQEKLEQAASVARIHMGGTEGTFNRKGWQHIIDKHNGFLPIRIRAVPEGTRVPTGNVMMTMENTDPECFWLTNYLETLIVQVWFPSTVATVSNYCRELILAGLEKTGTPALIDFKLHDFGFRGVSSVESAGIGGLAHLVNFKGTDTLAALGVGMEYYDAGMAGFSIPASEHSTITSWGENNEVDAFRNMLTQYPEGPVACVSDSFDIDEACSTLWGKELKDEVLKRNGFLVVRPDSGEIVSSVLKVPLGIVFSCVPIDVEIYVGPIDTSSPSGRVNGSTRSGRGPLAKSRGCLGSQSSGQTINPSHVFFKVDALTLNPQRSQMAL